MMQKLIYVDNNYVSEVNGYLKNGWKVVSMIPAVYGNSTHNCGAYVVIETKDGDVNA